MGGEESNQEQQFMGFPLSTYRSIVGMFILAVVISAGIIYIMGVL